MRASSVVVSVGLLVAGCVPSQEGVELLMEATYFPSSGTVIKKSPKGREQIMFISTTAASVAKSDHEQRHFAALDSWLGERSLCQRGYAKLDHRAGTAKGPDLGSTLVAPIDTRTMQTMIACK